MGYAVFILRRAQKELAQLPIETYERVLEAIRGLAEDPRPPGCLKLTGREGWRIRVGGYRVIYDIDDAGQAITVFQVGHRRDVYDCLPEQVHQRAGVAGAGELPDDFLGLAELV